MSDAPQGPGWWYAADGKWYPPPPVMSSEVPARPPTPAPDHPPYGMAPDASGFPTHSPEAVPSRSRNKALFAVSAVAVILAFTVVGLIVALVGRSGSNFRSADQQYEVVVTDVIDAESINNTFLETFWQGYVTYIARWNAAPESVREEITLQWLDDAQSEIGQFRQDLQGIDAALTARAFDDASRADEVRDAAVAHYRSWQNWAADMPGLVDEWSDADTDATLDEYIDITEPELGEDINGSFLDLCDSLSDNEPSDGSYESTIYEICAG